MTEFIFKNTYYPVASIWITKVGHVDADRDRHRVKNKIRIMLNEGMTIVSNEILHIAADNKDYFGKESKVGI